MASRVPAPLTSLAAGAGCGCKLPAAALLPVVRALPAQRDPRLLVGSGTSDDAAIVDLGDGRALVQTIDFFTPLVDDPHDFGRIAATNALSDVYAMGGTPLSAMNVLAWPLDVLGVDVLAEVLRGGQEVVAAAGAVLVGGHSIDDAEPKYGLAVTGLVDADAALSNAGGRPDDVLVLTKPLGVGAVVAARKRGAADDALLARAVEAMTTLNADASRAALAAGAHAMTDVTGYGLLGHLHHVARESGLSAELDAATVPALEGVQVLLEDDGAGHSGGARRNADWAAAFADIGPGVDPWRARLLTDAQTSGGLLVALPPSRAADVPGVVVGRLVEGDAGTIAVR